MIEPSIVVNRVGQDRNRIHSSSGLSCLDISCGLACLVSESCTSDVFDLVSCFVLWCSDTRGTLTHLTHKPRHTFYFFFQLYYLTPITREHSACCIVSIYIYIYISLYFVLFFYVPGFRIFGSVQQMMNNI